MKRYGGWIVFIILCVGITAKLGNESMKVKQVINEDLIKADYYIEYEQQSFDFIEKYLKTQDGSIKETYVTNKKQDVNEITLDIKTQNLYLLYLLNKDKKDEFEQTFKYVKKSFIREEGIVVGRTHNGETLGTSSTGDALDLIKICMLAYDKWGEAQYREVALTIEAGIYQYGIKDYRLYNKYQDIEEAKEKIDLVQVDLNAMRALAHYRPEWKKIYDNMHMMIESAYISDVFPFYTSSYYDSREASEEEQQIDMVQTLEIVLHLAQVNAHKPQTIEWLKEHLKTDGLFAAYDRKAGLATTQDKNIEEYALIAQIGKSIGDAELYTLAIEEMLKFQVRGTPASYEGAFVSDEAKEIRGSENVQCLLGF